MLCALQRCKLEAASHKEQDRFSASTEMRAHWPQLMKTKAKQAKPSTPLPCTSPSLPPSPPTSPSPPPSPFFAAAAHYKHPTTKNKIK